MVGPRPPTTAHPARILCKMSVFRVNKKMLMTLVNKLNDSQIYVEDLKSYVNKDALKALALVPLNSIYGVFVCESGIRRGLPPNHILPFADDYAAGPTYPIYGNIIICYSDKAWEALPSQLKSDINAVTL